MELIALVNMRIGDVVVTANEDGTPFGQSYNHMTVINVTNEEITFFRPYVNLANFTYTGGVIPYVGMEKFSVPVNNPCKYLLLDNIYRGE